MGNFSGPRIIRHGYASPFRSKAFSVIVVFSVMLVGTVGMHYLAGYSYIDSFYFMSMLATAEGPTLTPPNDASKIFAAIMAFISVGSVIVALTFIFGPFFGKILNVGERTIKAEERDLARESKMLERKVRR